MAAAENNYEDELLLSVVDFVFRDDDEGCSDDHVDPVQINYNLVVDIDAPDADDELAAVEYVRDMYLFYDATEDDGRVDHDYMMDPQMGMIINKDMRSILVDWLIGVHKKFQLMPQVLYLAVNILDRFLSVTTDVRTTQLQLVAMCSMLIACKYEHDDWGIQVIDFVEISDNAYDRDQVLRMEKAILEKLEWRLSVPTPYVYLVRFIKASIPADVKMENLAFFYAELGLTDYRTSISYSPSMLAASAVYAARCTLNKRPLWTETLKYYTGFSEDQLRGCARLLVEFHLLGKDENKLGFVFQKYSDPERGAVALINR